MAEYKLQMTEIAEACSGISHEDITDGTVKAIELGGNLMETGRLGAYCYYHMRLHNTSPGIRILPQARPEARLIYLINGRRLYLDGADGHKVIACGEANCTFVPKGYGQDITVLDEDYCEVLIIATPQLDFSQWFPRGAGETLACRPEIANLQFKLEQATIIRQFIDPGKPAYLRSTYRQIKLAELFVLFFEQAGQFDDTRTLDDLRPEEMERMQKVRDMLHNRPAESYSLNGLARTFGTNEASLKKNFKAIYGTTVFKYLTARRMELARDLLLVNKLKVSEVAHEVGYKYASHFTAVFRKHFGFLPTKMRISISLSSFLTMNMLESVNPIFFAV